MLFTKPIHELVESASAGYAKAPVYISTNSTQELTVPCKAHDNSSTEFFVQFDGRTLMEREVFIEYDLTLHLQHPTNDNDINLFMSDFCVSHMPLNTVIRRSHVAVNNTNVSFENANMIKALQFYTSNDFCDIFPNQKDTINNLNCLDRQNTGNEVLNICPLENNFRKAGGASGLFNSRASQRPSNITFTQSVGNNDILDITYHITETLINPYFNTLIDSDDVLANITSLNVKLDYLPSLLPAFQVNSITSYKATGPTRNKAYANTLLNTSVKITNPVMRLRIFYPAKSLIPAKTVHPLPDYTKFVFSTEGANGPSYSGTFDTGIINMSKVPDQLMIFIKKRDDPSSLYETSAFGAVSKLTLQTDSATSLNNVNSRLLYEISSRNGYNGKYNDFVENIGSVIYLDLRKADIPAVIPQQNTAFSFRLFGEFLNTTYGVVDILSTGFRTDPYNPATPTPASFGATTSFSLYVISINQGHAIMMRDNCIRDVGIKMY